MQMRINYKLSINATTEEERRRRTGSIGIWHPEAGLNKHTHIHEHEILGLEIKQK